MEIQKRDEYYAEIVKAAEAENWDKVLEACTRISELNLPELEKSMALVNAAKAHGHLKNLKEAIKCFDRAIEIEKRHQRFFALSQKAEYLAEQNLIAESLAIYKELTARKDLYLSDVQRFSANIEALEIALKNG